MAFTPTLAASTTSALAPPAQMQDFILQKDSETGNYDIINQFTPPNNLGNLMVIQSKIILTLNTNQGEWQPDPNFGLPFQAMLNASDNPDVVSQVLVNTILPIQNVNNVIILSLDLTAVTRNLKTSLNVNTAFGTTLVNVG